MDHGQIRRVAASQRREARLLRADALRARELCAAMKRANAEVLTRVCREAAGSTEADRHKRLS